MKSFLEIIPCKNIENNIVRVAESTYHWLCYVHNSTDTNVLAESSIRYPFVECLERLGYDNIHLEALHPEFSNRRMDVFCGNVTAETNTGIINDKLIFYAEFKFVKSYTRDKSERQRIFNDIMRLYAIKVRSHHSHCYFIICGDTVTFNDCFMKIRNAADTKSTIVETTIAEYHECDATGPYAELFPFSQDEGPKDFRIDDDLYNKFCTDYNYNNIEKDSKIKTRLVAFFSHNECFKSPQTLAVWEIL